MQLIYIICILYLKNLQKISLTDILKVKDTEIPCNQTKRTIKPQNPKDKTIK